MQTFLPYDDFVLSLDCLDYRRLGKQRVESMQLLNAMKRTKGGWVNHPATKMWRGFEKALTEYMNLSIMLWIDRGYKNTMKIVDVGDLHEDDYPPWFGDNKFHASHRSNLLQKDFEFYSKYGWDEKPGLPYYWPDKILDSVM